MPRPAPRPPSRTASAGYPTRRAPGALLLALAGLVLASAPATAQTNALAVHVSGPEGPLADVSVELILRDVVIVRAGTDEAGVARIVDLPLGTFRLRVESLGYRTVTREVTVGPGAQRVEVELDVAPIDVDEIVVETERVRIDRENIEFSSRVDEEAIQLLPMTHDPADIVELTPGARPGHVWGGANLQANSYRIDGLSANHPGLGGDLLQPSVHWIDRVEVRGLGAGAEYGGFQGGLIDVVTKRGTNDFQGAIRTSVDHELLSASNLTVTEIGREPVHRTDLEGEARGPILRDRLFYYVSGERVAAESRTLNHLPGIESRYSPVREERTEHRAFGKLTWTPVPGRVVELSGAYTDVSADNFGASGHEAAGATHAYSSPTVFVNGSITEILGPWGTLTGRVNHFSRDERYDPYQGTDVPGIRTWSFAPPYTAFGNAPLTLRSAPSSTSGAVTGSFRIRTGGLEHGLKVGAEYTRGSFLDERIRNGNLTWQGVRSSRFDPGDPSTWSQVSQEQIATTWGGEVRLDADVASAAAYAQGSLSLGSRVVLTPGIRWARWTGWITPPGGERFQAVQDDGLDPRIGASIDLTGGGDFVAKAHWGRYHQNLISQMFDRVAGSATFTNEEHWWYRGDAFSDPTRSFTEAERDAGAATGEWAKFGEVFLNETGPVVDYAQPYVDQWLVGLEKELSSAVKVEALYTRRANHDMVALVDRNRHLNYTRFENVRLFLPNGQVAPFQGGSILLPELWVPNSTILPRLLCLGRQECDGAPGIPGLTPADTLNLIWDPDYVLTTAPDARREFDQLQLHLELALPEWGASFSLVRTGLVGNLDNVSGYTDPDEFGPGPYVRVNEHVNAFGNLENYSNTEWKLSAWGILPGDVRAGLFYTYRSGDHYSPQFRLYGLGFFTYKVGTGALESGRSTTFPGEVIPSGLLHPLEGHDVFVGPRGGPTLDPRADLDLRFERAFAFGGREVAVSVDIFNLFGSEAVTDLNTMVNNGPDYGFPVQRSPFAPPIAPNLFYQAAEERVPPRSFRFGLAAFF